MSSVKSSFAIAIGERGVLIALNLISYVLVARLVTPDDVGAFSVASAFVALLTIFRDFGSGYYIATQRELTQEGFATAFTFSLLIGLCISAVVTLIAPLFGGFFSDVRVENILKILAVNAPILAVTGCLMTVLRRNFQYGKVFWVNLSGTLIGSVVTLALAYKKYGAYALAVGVTSNYVATAVLSAVVKSPDYRLSISFHSWREVVSLGGKTSIVGGLQQFSTSALEMLVGRYLGFHEAGLLSRAMGVVNLFNRDFSEAIRSVTIHSFSRASREGKSVAELHSIYLINYSAFGFFFFSFVWCFPREALYILSGPQWLDAEQYLQLFALMGMITTLYQLLPVLTIAVGRIGDLVKVSFVSEFVKILFCGYALHFVGGGVAYGCAWIAAVFVVCILFWWYLGLRNGIGDFKLAKILLLGCVLGWTASYSARIVVRFPFFDSYSMLSVLGSVAAGVFAAVAFIGLLYLFDHPLGTMLHQVVFRGRSVARKSW